MTEAIIDEEVLRSLHAKGHSQTALARLLHVSRSTVQARMKKLGLAPVPMFTIGTHDVHTDKTMSTSGIHQKLDGMVDDLSEIVTWWQERKATLQTSQDDSRETRRVTFFVEKRWEDMIRRQSDIDGLTYTQIVNEAFKQYFEGKRT